MSKLGNAILENMTEIDNERTEACIHCKKVWYSIHYRDGVCSKCRELGKPGRLEIAAKKKARNVIIAATIIIVVLVTVSAIFG